MDYAKEVAPADVMKSIMEDEKAIAKKKAEDVIRTAVFPHVIGGLCMVKSWGMPKDCAEMADRITEED